MGAMQQAMLMIGKGRVALDNPWDVTGTITLTLTVQADGGADITPVSFTDYWYTPEGGTHPEIWVVFSILSGGTGVTWTGSAFNTRHQLSSDRAITGTVSGTLDRFVILKVEFFDAATGGNSLGSTTPDWNWVNPG